MEVHIKGNNGKYISSENGEKAMKCDRGLPLEWERFIIEDVGEGKVALKSRGRYVSSENGREPMKCNRAWLREWEKFEIIHHPNGTCSFKGNNGRYVSSEDGCGNVVTCNRDVMGYWEYFVIEKVQSSCSCSDAVQKLQAQVAALTKKNSKAIEELEYQVSELREGHDGSSTAIGDLENEVLSLSCELDGSSKLIEELKNQVDELKQENLELRKNLEYHHV